MRVESQANSKDRARTRVLSDDEIRLIWPLLDEAGTFGAAVKVLLLTAQRRDEVAHMSRKEIDQDRNLDDPSRAIEDEAAEPRSAFNIRACHH